MTSSLERAAQGWPLSEQAALELARHGPGAVRELTAAACELRDREYGRTLTYSPKVFLPLTNLCRNRCDYCSFRRSPGEPGAHTMDHAELDRWLARAAAQGCIEALFCLGDKPEGAFSAYRDELAALGHASTVGYLEFAGRRALELGLLPHTNAGVLSARDMERLRPVNVSLGLMLENISPRLCERGMPHHRAPDKRPQVRVRMIEEAGELAIPFTTGILVGIGETAAERVQSLIAIRDLHRRHRHIQEVIVQNLAPHPATGMARAGELSDGEMRATVALARLILDSDISVQSPPNLNAGRTLELVAAGINDFGGISPVSPDYINPRHPWPHLSELSRACADSGFALRPRLPVYPRYVEETGFIDPGLRGAIAAASARLLSGPLATAARVGAADDRETDPMMEGAP